MLKKIIFALIALTALAYVMYSCATSSKRVGLPSTGAGVSSEGGEFDAAAGSEAAVTPPSANGIVDDGIVGIMPAGEEDDDVVVDVSTVEVSSGAGAGADGGAGANAAAGSGASAGAGSDATSNAGEAASPAAADKAASGKDKNDKKTVLPSFTTLKSESGWYLSNGSGMILEKTFQARALRNTYAIQILNVKPENVPKEIAKYYSATWKIECRILYHEGRRIRTQWVFKDAGMSTLFNASIAEDGSGFLEWYDDKAYVVEEQRLAADGSGLFISYTYNGQYLLKAEAVVVAPVVKPEPKKTEAATPEGGADAGASAEAGAAPGADAVATPGTDAGADAVAAADAGADAGADAAANAVAAETAPPSAPAAAATPQPQAASAPTGAEARRQADLIKNPDGPVKIPEFYVAATGRETDKLWTDNYRYTRSKALRAVVRTNYAVNADVKFARLTFPRFVADSEEDKSFVVPASSSTSRFLLDIMDSSAKITYSLDPKKRVLLETHRDDEENIIGELTNVWEGDRIKSIKWDSESDKRMIEYAYNSKGDRIIEKDYKNGILERVVEIDGNREDETLYFDNKVVLRAVWEDGLKISETRVH